MFKRPLFLLVMILVAMIMGQSIAMASVVPDITYLRVWPEYDDNQVMFLEAVQLSQTTTLPAEVKVAIPKGASITWVGELLQGDPAQDPDAVYKVNPKDDYDEVVFTLTKSNIGQVEARWNGLSVDGANRTLNLDWTQHYESKQTIFEFREPSQTSDVKLTPPAIKTDVSSDGSKFHQTAPVALGAGQKQSFQVTYKRSTDAPTVAGQQTQPAQTGGTAQPTSQPTDFATWIVIAIVAGIVVFAVYGVRRKSDKSADRTRESMSTGMKAAIVAIVLFVGVIGYGVANKAVTTSKGVPSGNNCEENVAYLQAGVDQYREAFGVNPIDLKQLLESKDGKGPFVETIDLQCPTEKKPYMVVNGKVEQVP